MDAGDAPWLDEVVANAEIRRLRMVLRHYADRANWSRCPGASEDEAHCCYRQWGDGWEVAAAALATNPLRLHRIASATPPASVPAGPLLSAARASRPPDRPA